MSKGIIKGAIIGGLIFFVWSFVSWMVLPWHKGNLQTFKSERQMRSVISENCKTDGIYMMPSKEEDMGKGPRVFASVTLKPSGSIVPHIVIGLINNLVSAFFIAWMLTCVSCTAYFSRVIYVTGFGLVAWLINIVPAWNWWGYSPSWIGVELADNLIGWFLAGLAMAGLVKSCCNRNGAAQ